LKVRPRVRGGRVSQQLEDIAARGRLSGDMQEGDRETIGKQLRKLFQYEENALTLKSR
jgi:hypothetical protein